MTEAGFPTPASFFIFMVGYDTCQDQEENLIQH